MTVAYGNTGGPRPVNPLTPQDMGAGATPPSGPQSVAIGGPNPPRPPQITPTQNPPVSPPPGQGPATPPGGTYSPPTVQTGIGGPGQTQMTPAVQPQVPQTQLTGLRGEAIMPPSGYNIPGFEEMIQQFLQQTQEGTQGIGAGNSQLSPFQSVQGGGSQFGPWQGVQAPTDPNIRNFQGIAAQMGGDVQGLTSLLNQQAMGLSSAPDRAALAQEAFDIMSQRREPEFERRLQDTGRRAAALGRVGSGVTTSEFGDVLQGRERDLDLLQRELSLDSANRAFGDRITGLNTLSGVQGQRFGQDQGLRDEARGERGAGIGYDAMLENLRAGLRGEARGERDSFVGFQDLLNQTGRADRNEQRGELNRLLDYDFASADLGRADRNEARSERSQMMGLNDNALAQILGTEGALRGFGAQDRNEIRGERGYGDALEQQAFDRRLQQLMLEDQRQNTRFDQNLRQGQAAGAFGFGGGPGQAYSQVAGQQGAQGAQQSGAGMEALWNWIMNRQGGGGNQDRVAPSIDPRAQLGVGA